MIYLHTEDSCQQDVLTVKESIKSLPKKCKWLPIGAYHEYVTYIWMIYLHTEDSCQQDVLTVKESIKSLPILGSWHWVNYIHYKRVRSTVYPKKYAHGFCFAVLCCGYTLTDFPISIRLISLALWQSNDCPSASKATLMNMDKYFMWIHYERLHNHNKAKHNKTVCIFLGIYCRWLLHVMITQDWGTKDIAVFHDVMKTFDILSVGLFDNVTAICNLNCYQWRGKHTI